MKMMCGLKSGAILQRNAEDLCRCYFKAEAVGEIRASLGNVVTVANHTYMLTDIPTGGPYEVTLWDDESRVELTDIYVGDLWLLGGQSNMEGAGKWRDAQKAYDENPIPSIRAYYMNESWGVAKTQLHQLWESIDECISGFYRSYRKNSLWGAEYPEVQADGVGPGLYFALEMQRRMGGVPQGVIPCGIGGASMDQWNPEGEDNYYTAAARRVKECGGIVRGVFWYQGEAQAWEPGCNSFVSDMQRLVGAMRRDFNHPDLPFVQVQINRYAASPAGGDIWWTRLRELQRNLERHIDHLATVYSVDSELDDLIHLSSESQVNVGKRAAEAMVYLVTGEGVPSPDVDFFEIVQDDFVPFRVNVRVHFRHIVGKLEAPGVPVGFTIHEAEDQPPMREIARLCLEGDTVRIKVEIDPAKIEDCYVCYAYGNTYYCNITDSAGRSLPGFGPLKIKDYLK